MAQDNSTQLVDKNSLVELAKDYTEATFMSPTQEDYWIIQNAMIQGYLLAVEQLRS